MSIESELFTFLTVTSASVANLIGDSLYPGVIPQKPELPAIAYNRIVSTRVQSLTGSSDLPTGRFQFSCYATSLLGSIALSETVRAALNDFSGAMGSTTVQHASLVDEGDLPAFAIGDSKRITYGRRLDFDISYNEA